MLLLAPVDFIVYLALLTDHLEQTLCSASL